MNSQGWRSPWPWAAAFGLVCMCLAYGVYWKHGPYHDDYFLYSWSFKQLVDILHYEVRPVGKLIGAIIFSAPEIVVRMFSASMVIGTSLLGGLLLYRLFKIRLAALSVSLLCLVPFAGTEAVTWTNALIHYMPAGFFSLLALNLFLSALRAGEQPRSRTWLALLSGLTLVLAFGSIEPAANFAIVFLGLLLIERGRQPEQTRQMLGALAQAVLFTLISGALIYATFYVSADQVSSRGVIELPSLDRLGRFLMDFPRRGFGGPFGLEMMRISNIEGWEALRTNRAAQVFALTAAGTAIALNLRWKTEKIQAAQKKPQATRINIMIAACLLATLASMLLPAALMSHENGSPRLAYLPGIGGTFLAGCLIARVMVMRRPLVGQRLILAFITFSVVLLSAHLLGYTRMYHLRYKFDQLQVETLLKAVPREAVAGKDIVFLPFEVHENFLGYPTYMNPNFLLIGGLSSANSVGTILKQAYPQTAISVIRPDYGNFAWSIAPGKNRTLLLAGYRGDPPREVAPDDLVLFRFRQNAVVELAEAVRFTDDKGVLSDEVKLPWAARLHGDYGTGAFTVECPSLTGPIRRTSGPGGTAGRCLARTPGDADPKIRGNTL
ncbi:MAG: hypothetical protein HZB33_01515 [Nitrospirae bacterium]|nr:hypothetical protein [Nitrospirota bacterium]